MVEISPQAAPSSHRPDKPPSDAKLRALLGPAWNRYQSALKGLAGMDLIPEFYRYGPSGGWALRFEIDHTTGCALYLAKSLTGLVAVGRQSQALLEERARGDDQLLRLVRSAPRRGETRWVQLPLRSDEDVHRFLTLTEAKLRASAEESGPDDLNHTPHRQTTAGAAGRRKSDIPPRRSAARRSSRD